MDYQQNQANEALNMISHLLRNLFSLRTLAATLGLGIVFLPSHVQAQSDAKSAAEKEAIVSFFNACSTDMSEHWKASVDVYFKGEPLCQDLRMGESSLLRTVLNDGQGSLEIRKSGTDQVLTQVSAAFMPKTFNTVLLTGLIGSGSSSVKALVLRDYPLEKNQIPADRARLVIASGISNYPTNVSIGGQILKNLKPGAATEMFMPPGEHEIKMFFIDKKLGPGFHNTSSGLLAESGKSYNVFFFDSPRLPGRPRVTITNLTQSRQDFIDAANAPDEEEAQSPVD